MEEQITLDLISTFSDVYNSDPQNKMIEDKITKNGLEESLINKTIIKENKPVFNIELPDSKRYDQKDNFRCWIYSGLNTIKYDVAKNLNIDLKSFSLSNSYIAFFDKLEKSNNTYENIINLQDTSLKYINKEKILKEALNTNNDIVITSSGLLGDLDKYYKLYSIREIIEQNPNYKNDVSFEENFEDDGFTFRSSLCIRKNG